MIRIPLSSSFSFDAVVRSHGWYDLPPFSYEPEKSALAALVEAGGEPVAVKFQAKDGHLEASSRGLDRKALSGLARRVFSLDIELDAFAASLEPGSPLARGLERGGGRMLRAPSVFEDAVKMLLTTNCSWAATKGMVRRLIELAGAGGLAFPSARRIASISVSTLERKVRCGYRAKALALFSRRVASGAIDLSRWEDPETPAEELRAGILEEHGFGPYAAEGLLRILGHHEFLALDSWVRQQYRRLYPGPARSTDSAIGRRYARYGRYRGLALWLEMTREWHEPVAPSLRS